MSYHVYIARPGIKETPIPQDAWLNAARHCDSVAVEERKNRRGEVSFHVALRGNRRAWLQLTQYGLIQAQDPPKELIAAMFKLADELQAGVYSERLKKYQSVDDWEQHTREYRAERDARLAAQKRARLSRIVMWVLVVAIAVYVGLRLT